MSIPPRRYKVFLADDSALVREKLRGLFSTLPAIEICGEAANAVDAIVAIQSTAADAVVLDLDLGATSGLDVLRAIKRVAAAPVVIILSIHPFGDFGEHSLREGADHYFEKGENFDVILDVLERLSLRGAQPAN